MNFLPHINFTNCLNLKMALKSLDQTKKKHILFSVILTDDILYTKEKS